MGYSQNLDSIRDQTIYHAEGKPFQEEALRTPNIPWPNFGILRNFFNGTIKFSKEGMRCCSTAFPVPMSSRLRFSNSFRMDIIALRFWFGLLAKALA